MCTCSVRPSGSDGRPLADRDLGGRRIPGLNLTIDPEHMFASYTVPDVFDSTFHHASMRVFDMGMVVVGLSGSQMSILMPTWSIKPTCMTCCGPTLSRLWRPGQEAPWPATAAD